MSTREAGRKLDALIAEKVMGWTWATVDFYWDRGGETYLIPPEGRTAYSVLNTTSGSWDWLDRKGRRRILNDLPQFSEDMGAAWDVVEKVGFADFTLYYAEGRPVATRWDASFGAQTDGEGKTAPLAICRAALAAVSA